jgi:hypothetical membrane protein
VRGNRLRWGALGWVLTLQFFVVETVVGLQLPGYSWSDDVISDLGSALSPAHRVMNASFVLQAALMLVGVALLLPALRGRAARLAQVFLAVSAVGVLLVGVFPEDGSRTLHDVGAIGYLAGGAIGLLALAYAVRPRSEGLGTAVAVLGLAGAATTIFFFTDVTQGIGRGTTERIAGYVVPIGLALTAVVLWRMAGGAAALPDVAAGPSRRQLREEARAEHDRRAAERDAALEAAAQRREERPATAAAPVDHRAADEDDDFDPEDPWATPSRRRET